MLTTGQILDLAIETVVYRGDGLGRHEGQVVFVPGTLAGERTRVRVTQLHRRFATAELLELLQPAATRRTPCCRLADGARVPGCVYDHVDYAAEVAIKQAQLASFLRPLDAAVTFDPPLPAPQPLGYRNKIVLHAQRARDGGGRRLGYRGSDNRSVVDLPSCPLACDAINRALAVFRHTRLSTLPDGVRVTFRHTVADGVVDWLDTPDPAAPPLTEASPAGPLQLPRDGFSQVNPPVADALVRHVAALFAQTAAAAPRPLIDLYCGVGVFAFACARSGHAETLLGIESGRAAIAAARANAARLGARVTFRCDTVAAAAASRLEGVDAARATVILDPPRQGLEAGVAASLAALQPADLILVSCDPATLARDLRLLLPAGYRIQSARLFDMFPRTAHFETVVWLHRQPAAPPTPNPEAS